MVVHLKVTTSCRNEFVYKQRIQRKWEVIFLQPKINQIQFFLVLLSSLMGALAVQ